MPPAGGLKVGRSPIAAMPMEHRSRLALTSNAWISVRNPPQRLKRLLNSEIYRNGANAEISTIPLAPEPAGSSCCTASHRSRCIT